MKLRFSHVQVSHLQIGDYARVDTIVIYTSIIWETVDGEDYFEWLILRSVKQLVSFENQNIGLGWE